MTARTRRPAFTLIEVIAVMAILILLAAVVLPSVGAFRGDSRPRAAADTIRGELATARGRAMVESRPYRVAIGMNGTRIRRGPDGPEFAEGTAADQPDANAATVEYAFEFVRASIVSSPSAAAPASGWETIAVVLPNGTCVDDGITVSVREDGGSALRVHVRGLTASSRVLPSGTKDRR